MRSVNVSDLTGIDGRTIRTTRWTASDRSARRTAVLLPGFAYSAEAPLLFYLKLVCIKRGWDVLAVDYRYSEHDAFLAMPDYEKDAFLRREHRKIGEFLADTLDCDHLILIGKSLGTSALFTMLTETAIRSAAERVGCVLLTPSERQHELFDILVADGVPAVVAIGDEDQYYDQSSIGRLREACTVRVLVVENAGHLFEDADRDMGRSIDNVRDVTIFVEEALDDGFLSVTI